MNAPDRVAFLPDIQAGTDDRNLPIDAVGIKGVRHPVSIRASCGPQRTIATLALSVALPALSKGTHMSRFIELLMAQTEALGPREFKAMLLDLLERLDARSGTIEMRFPYFVAKRAPVSGARGLLDHEVCWRGRVSDTRRYSSAMSVTVPVTSLCPCSKEISAYGAHNQRSHISIDTELGGEMSIEELVAIAERCASCELYSLLKREDEKYVTERAYDNPKFVEDLVRDVALALDRDPRVSAYVVEVENFESIHNHSAVARIVRRPRAAGPGRAAGREVQHIEPAGMQG
jgi:MptA/FolE2 family GTP cyclohydrolase